MFAAFKIDACFIDAERKSAKLSDVAGPSYGIPRRLSMGRYRVLSLDGGGSWALIEAKALIKLFGAETSGRDVLRQFDLVAANSGGSIVLGCLVENFTLGRIVDLFMDQTTRLSIFSNTSSIGDRILKDLTGIGPKYSAKNKLPALQRVFSGQGDEPLTQVVQGVLSHAGTGEDVRLLMVGFDYDRLRATFFRSKASGGIAYGRGAAATVTLAEAIHASSNAPVNYFDGPADFPDGPDRYWDGAISGSNNPVLVGVTEAIAANKGFTDVVALSIGSATVALPWPQPGQESSPYVRQRSQEGLVNDLRKLATAILDDPPDMATFLAHVMTGSGGGVSAPGVADSQIVRMNPLISPVSDTNANQWKAPGNLTLAQFLALAALDMDAIEQHQVETIADYADQWLADQVPNQPVRMDGDTLKVEIGQGTFSGALAAWNAIKN
jgi:uncharacterized protein